MLNPCSLKPNDTDRVRVKICGITSVEDAMMAADTGADAIGCVFYEPSPRNVSITSAEHIVRSVGPFVSTVGLFVNATITSINNILRQVPLHILQFHGDETAAFCEQFQRPYIKAIRMKPGLDVATEIQQHPHALAILLDTYHKGVPGGTGTTFDWSRVPPRDQGQPHLILAGGLTPTNVSGAIRQTCPYAVDVSGGVEHSQQPTLPTTKDPQKVAAFIRNATQKEVTAGE